MEADIDVHGKSKQLSGGCKRNQGRPGRGGRLKCKHCRKAAQKCTRISESVTCDRCTKRGLGIRECGSSLLPQHDPTPRRALKKLSIDDPEEIQLVERHRARRAIEDNARSERPDVFPFNMTSDVTPAQGDNANALAFPVSVTSASAGEYISNPNQPSSTEETSSTSIGRTAEIGMVSGNPLWNDTEWEEFLRSFLT